MSRAETFGMTLVIIVKEVATRIKFKFLNLWRLNFESSVLSAMLLKHRPVKIDRCDS